MIKNQEHNKHHTLNFYFIRTKQTGKHHPGTHNTNHLKSTQNINKNQQTIICINNKPTKFQNQEQT